MRCMATVRTRHLRNRGQQGRKDGSGGAISGNASSRFSRRKCLEVSTYSLAKWNNWVRERLAQGKESRLYALVDPNEALSGMLGFMVSRCYVHNSWQSAIRGYLAAISFFHKMMATVGKRIDRRWSMSQKNTHVRYPADVVTNISRVIVYR